MAPVPQGTGTGAPCAFPIFRPGSRGMIRRLLDGLYLLSGVLAAIFLLVIFLLMIGLSSGRDIGFDIPAGDDFASWSMVAMSFLGLAHTFKKGEMIRVGLLLERLTGRKRQVMELFALTVGIVFLAYFTKNAIQLTYDSYRFDDMSQGVIAVPLWIPQTGYALGITILLIAMIDEFVHVASGHHPRYEKEPPKTPEELIERVASGGGV
ncbi:hypothetical protein AZC_0169 [Azorhizobium caulinodans ORS 571]|uniref:TRAP transporter small permease protein n=2 Tax=Azorhizobium caulinodans TaxID=7 RepID=A8IH38_AZOC5|nr:hypothetical protein AZC_0169 [Azorhizobium caulinodans ORS 571]